MTDQDQKIVEFLARELMKYERHPKLTGWWVGNLCIGGFDPLAQTESGYFQCFNICNGVVAKMREKRWSLTLWQYLPWMPDRWNAMFSMNAHNMVTVELSDTPNRAIILAAYAALGGK